MTASRCVPLLLLRRLRLPQRIMGVMSDEESLRNNGEHDQHAEEGTALANHAAVDDADGLG